MYRGPWTRLSRCSHTDNHVVRYSRVWISATAIGHLDAIHVIPPPAQSLLTSLHVISLRPAADGGRSQQRETTKRPDRHRTQSIFFGLDLVGSIREAAGQAKQWTSTLERAQLSITSTKVTRATASDPTAMGRQPELSTHQSTIRGLVPAERHFSDRALTSTLPHLS